MKREYTEGTKEDVVFFTGIEIEQTPAFGMQTLFVVGVQPPSKILELASLNDCKHIYFGANQSFPFLETDDADGWRPWEKMIRECLDAGIWCTLDIDIYTAHGLLETDLVTYRRFIPQLSVKIPYLNQYGYNATLKIDDYTFDYSNPGVWCHKLRNLTTDESFTGWDEYGKDKVIKS